MASTKRVRTLRRKQTEAERLLWEALRNRGLGAKWRRQHKIGRYIVDFYCVEKKLVIEVDGRVHLMRARRDMERDSYMEDLGLRILRFRNREILRDRQLVAKRIRETIERG